jgi:ABC-type arginine/histidine transport system permease subunit
MPPGHLLDFLKMAECWWLCYWGLQSKYHVVVFERTPLYTPFVLFYRGNMMINMIINMFFIANK